MPWPYTNDAALVYWALRLAGWKWRDAGNEVGVMPQHAVLGLRAVLGFGAACWAWGLVAGGAVQGGEDVTILNVFGKSADLCQRMELKIFI